MSDPFRLSKLIATVLSQKIGDIFRPKEDRGFDTYKPMIHHIKASSFADPADVRAFRKCKLRGGTDQECFKVGDNGIGRWGDDTTADKPMCALPPEDWEHLGSKARGAKVLVKANGREVVCELRDTMPRKKNIKNGAGIDLNPAAVEAIGLTPPIMVSATWEWVEAV
jgi:hypothetical protein